ncbi:MAG: multidrug ABC transporter substrate-binding protein [Hyphomicrobiales bacterium]|nr:MAG: multidrug ABC transporter substrate-binding protein [Hyphomicrobiales bacterium]
MLYETLKLALQAIRRNALRSFLTILGIVIGVGAVIAMVTIGNGTTVKVQDQIGRLGSNLLFVHPGQGGPGRAATSAPSFNSRDVDIMREQLTGVKAVTGLAQSSSTVVFGSESHKTTVSGTDNDYLITQAWSLTAGRQFLDGELRSGRAVCIIGDTIREELFGGIDPIGERFRVGNVSCEIIGLLEAKGQSSFGTDQDDIVLMPLRTLQRRITGNSDVARILISAEDDTETAALQADTERLLRERRKIGTGMDDNFTVRDTKQLAETMTGTTSLMTGLLGAVAAVSLLVGGIGIMNIMLVSVTERTREIGIRLAIGALENQVLFQFLIEAVVLSLLGGLIGISLGLGLAYVASLVLKIPYVVDYSIVVASFGFSAFIGVVFGYFPARRAARMNPIDALRHE